MNFHNDYLIFVSVLFALIFAVQAETLRRHRRRGLVVRRGNGRGQWIWALVPLAIVGAVNFALFEAGGGVAQDSPGPTALTLASGTRR